MTFDISPFTLAAVRKTTPWQELTTQNDFFKPTFLPKNEQTNSTLLLVDLFLFVFWKKVKTPKRQFEINWPLILLNPDKLNVIEQYFDQWKSRITMYNNRSETMIWFWK